MDMAWRPPEIAVWTGLRPWPLGATAATDDYVHDCSPNRGGGGRQAGCAGSHSSSPPDHSERVREPQRPLAHPGMLRLMYALSATQRIFGCQGSPGSRGVVGLAL